MIGKCIVWISEYGKRNRICLVVFLERVVGFVKVGIDGYYADPFGTVGVVDLGLVNVIFKRSGADDGIENENDGTVVGEIRKGDGHLIEIRQRNGCEFVPYFEWFGF